MSRKDYIVIANGLIKGINEYKRKNNIDEIMSDCMFTIISSLEDELYKDNNKFDFDKFRTYVEERICCEDSNNIN